MNSGVGNWLVKHAHYDAERIALVYGGRHFTYKELNERVNRLAHALRALGVRKGDRVIGLLFNTNEMIEAVFACGKIGAIFVPINFRLSFEEVLYIVNDSTANIFIYDERKQDIADRLRSQKTSILEFIHVGNRPHPEDLPYEQLMAQFPADNPRDEIHPEDVHFMMYTSGTTGRPKGAMLTHGNNLWNAINIINYLPVHYTDRTLTVAPLFHIGGMSCLTLPVFTKGEPLFFKIHSNPNKFCKRSRMKR